MPFDYYLTWYVWCIDKYLFFLSAISDQFEVEIGDLLKCMETYMCIPSLQWINSLLAKLQIQGHISYMETDFPLSFLHKQGELSCITNLK